MPSTTWMALGFMDESLRYSMLREIEKHLTRCALKSEEEGELGVEGMAVEGQDLLVQEGGDHTLPEDGQEVLVDREAHIVQDEVEEVVNQGRVLIPDHPHVLVVEPQATPGRVLDLLVTNS